MTIGEIIHRERSAKKMSMRKLAKEADVALATIVNVEKGYHEPSRSTLKCIAGALDLDVRDIMLEHVGSIVKEQDKNRNGAWYG